MREIFGIIGLIILGYLFGSIPYGWFFGKLYGVDLKKIGSGGIGFTNALRALGPKKAAPVVILDLGKGYLPTFMAWNFFNTPWITVAVATSTILGSVFPVWLRFRGGKGVTVFLGILAVLLPIKIWILMMISWGIILLLTRVMSTTNLLLVACFFAGNWFLFHSPSYLLFGFLVVVIIGWSHRENIVNAYKGKERIVKEIPDLSNYWRKIRKRPRS